MIELLASAFLIFCKLLKGLLHVAVELFNQHLDILVAPLGVFVGQLLNVMLNSCLRSRKSALLEPYDCLRP